MKLFIIISIILKNILTQGNQIFPTVFRSLYMFLSVTAPADVSQESCEKTLFSIEFIGIITVMLPVSCFGKILRLDLNAEDYTESEKIFDKPFNTIFQLKIDAVTKLDSTIRNVKARPNHNFKMTGNNQGYALLWNVMYRCEGYTDYNCNSLESKNTRYYLDPVNKKFICRDNKNCGDSKCDEQSLCKNGVCYEETYDSTKQYCACNNGYYGGKCEYKIPNIRFPDGLLVYATEQTLPKVKVTQNCENCYGKNCKIFDDKVLCLDIDNKTSIIECKPPCLEDCGDYICRKKLHDEKLFYLKTMKNNNN